jgi:hypothetical protein
MDSFMVNPWQEECKHYNRPIIPWQLTGLALSVKMKLQVQPA